MLLNTFISNNFVGAPAGGGPATFSDTFNRTPEDPLSGGGNWTRVDPTDFTGTVKTDGTHAIGNNSSADSVYMVATGAATFAANQKTTITLSDLIENESAAVRLNSDGTGYILYVVNDHQVQFYKLPTFTDLGTVDVPSMTSGATVSLSASGTSTVTLTAFTNGTSRGTATDSSSPVTSGQPGIHMYANNVSDQIDQFQADDL